MAAPVHQPDMTDAQILSYAMHMGIPKYRNKFKLRTHYNFLRPVPFSKSSAKTPNTFVSGGFLQEPSQDYIRMNEKFGWSFNPRSSIGDAKDLLFVSNKDWLAKQAIPFQKSDSLNLQHPEFDYTGTHSSEIKKKNLETFNTFPKNFNNRTTRSMGSISDRGYSSKLNKPKDLKPSWTLEPPSQSVPTLMNYEDPSQDTLSLTDSWASDTNSHHSTEPLMQPSSYKPIKSKPPTGARSFHRSYYTITAVY